MIAGQEVVGLFNEDRGRWTDWGGRVYGRAEMAPGVSVEHLTHRRKEESYGGGNDTRPRTINGERDSWTQEVKVASICSERMGDRRERAIGFLAGEGMRAGG